MIVCDIDGTLDIGEGRLHPVLAPLLARLMRHEEVVFLTARLAGKENRERTEALLRRAHVESARLVMRPQALANSDRHAWKLAALTALGGAPLVIDDDWEFVTRAVDAGYRVLHPSRGLIVRREQ